ncbi:ATP-binding protein [Flavobacteriaceae bacterium Ap0902]|nr:ATP-binding protein [Flavobacteriaceae bacterium Ap0902]
MTKKTWVSYSGGKDATLALYYLLRDKRYQIAGLFTTYNQSNDRVSMHGVSINLMKLQAASLGLPLELIPIPTKIDNHGYDKIMHSFLLQIKESGANTIAFGDIFLEDLKAYRTSRLKELNIEAIFPLWGKSTTQIITDFINLEFKAIAVSIDAHKIPNHLLGNLLTHEFISNLPKEVDPCGENGEYHTFVFNGPIFNKTIPFKKGEVVTQYYETEKDKFEFKFMDLIR